MVEVLGGSWESHDVQRVIHHSSSIKLTRALPPIPHEHQIRFRSTIRSGGKDTLYFEFEVECAPMHRNEMEE
jgi:hypothetical protein